MSKQKEDFTELTIVTFSCGLRDGARSLWAGVGTLGWLQPVGLWFGELPAAETWLNKNDMIYN